MPFVVIQVLMVAIVIAFPKIVTSNVSQAPGAIKGSGFEELQRQIGGAPSKGGAQKAPQKTEDEASEIEKALKGE